jgi:hypothetical protein
MRRGRVALELAGRGLCQTQAIFMKGPGMDLDDKQPKPFSEFQSWLLMGTIFFIAAIAIWLPVFVS